jgi:hypothetical protein
VVRQLLHQDSDRPLIGDGVMQRQQNRVLGRTQSNHRRTRERRPIELKRCDSGGLDQSVGGRLALGGSHVRHVVPRDCGGDLADLLHGPSIDGDQRRSQCFVTL